MLELDLSAVPPLSTARLDLDALQDSDAEALFVMRSDPVCMRFVPRPLARTVHDALAHIALVRAEQAENNSCTWAVRLKGDPTLIGVISLLRIKPEHHRTELGYLLSPAHWGRGLMTEAVAAVVDHAFRDLHFHSIEAIVDPRNVGSITVLERNGFVREGLFRENFLYNGEFLDSGVYALLAPSHG